VGQLADESPDVVTINQAKPSSLLKMFRVRVEEKARVGKYAIVAKMIYAWRRGGARRSIPGQQVD
jgi:hypothetical protein